MQTMMLGILVVCFFVINYTVDAWKFIGKNHFHRKLPKSATQLQSSYGTLGSDALVRPEDEDSPEFREYLKKLLDMQSNRAKAGFASPSSGSSDAYFAKLTRLKLEKIARRKAGLPEEVDTSYRPEDYLAAVSEMAEPTISNSALLAEAGMSGRPGNKVRSLTTEELRLAKAAEEVVQRELLLRSGQAPPPMAVELSPGTIVPGTIIEAMNKKNKAVSSAATTVVPPQISAPFPPPQAVNLPLQSAPTPPRAVTPPPPPVQTNPAPAVASQTAAKSWSPKSASASPSNPVSPAKAPTIVASTPSTPAVLKRKLTADELATVGKALEMTVKHRGGGPFGAGRLDGADLELLMSSLRSAVEVLREDSRQAQPVVEVAAPKTVARDPLPAIKPPTAAATPAQIQKSVPVAPKAEVPPLVGAMKQQTIVPPPRQAAMPPPPSMEVDEDAPMPIAMGIDRFLQNPKGSNYEDLCGLRDAVIQVLAMIQGEIANSTPSPSAPVLMPTRPAVDPTDRIVKEFYSAPPSAAAEGSANDEESRLRELKLSLGLLLKHRGGPGFGHGRLEGKEFELMESKLRSAAEILRDEAYSA
jgi:hypothetical protein